MNDPVFLTLEEVLQFHADQIEAHGGDGAILDLGKLESALAQPLAMFGGQYLHRDLAEMAAAYLFHIVQNHPFADGNKRTGTNAAIVFLELNEISLDYPIDQTEQLVLCVASGNATKSDVATFIRNLMIAQLGSS